MAANLLYRDAVAYGRARRRGLPASTPFARFLWRVLEAEHMSQGAFARSIGVSPAAVCRWLQGAAPPENVFVRLKDRYGDLVPAGVTTETERRRTKARENAAILNTAPAPIRATRARTAGRAGRGKPKPGHAEKLKAWHASPDGVAHRKRLVEIDAPRLIATVKSPHGQAAVSLGKLLDHNPHATLERIRNHAAVVGDRLGLTVDEVWAGWLPKLKQRGIVTGPGRPALRETKTFVDREIAKATRGAAGQLPSGFWPDLAVRLGRLPEDAESLRRWYIRLDKQDRGAARSR
jgi:transcriptional regulator with XRE-family HTH domain